MKKVMLLFGLFVVLAAQVFGHFFNPFSYAYGELPVLTIHGVEDGGDPEWIEECVFNYTYNHDYTINLANLTPDDGFGGFIPDGVPPVYLEVTIEDDNNNQSSAIYPLTVWTHVGSIGIYNEPHYISQINVNLEILSGCYNSATAELNVTNRLVTYDSDISPDPIPYPICDHNEIGKIYSCYVFEEIECDIDLDKCISDNYNVVYKPNITIECGEGCIDDLGGGGSGSRNALQDLDNEFNIAIASNPIIDNLRINWEGSNSDFLNFQVYDLSGNLVNGFELSGEAGSYSLDVSDLAKGIYFLSAFNNEKNEVIKFVKL